MTSLAEALTNYHNEIEEHLYLGCAHWDNLIRRIEQQERVSSGVCYSAEQIWTFLVGCGYAAAGLTGVATLTQALTGLDVPQPDDSKIWLEVLPTPPRRPERSTHIDLAVGTVSTRKGTESGIELGQSSAPWICFCEMKWYSDIDTKVTYDIHRNQLARVIENALCFQANSRYAENIYVALVTPKAFRDGEANTRLYQYKFKDYESDRASLLKDLNACILDKNCTQEWVYPSDIDERASRLNLRWLTYDDLFANIPASAISRKLGSFWLTHGRYQGRS